MNVFSSCLVALFVFMLQGHPCIQEVLEMKEVFDLVKGTPLHPGGARARQSHTTHRFRTWLEMQASKSQLNLPGGHAGEFQAPHKIYAPFPSVIIYKMDVPTSFGKILPPCPRWLDCYLTYSPGLCSIIIQTPLPCSSLGLVMASVILQAKFYLLHMDWIPSR